MACRLQGECKGGLPAISSATEWPYCPSTADPRKKSCHDWYVLHSAQA